MELYHDSLLTKFHYDEQGNPVAVDCQETQVVTNKAMVQLTEFPDLYHRVTVTQEDGSRLAEAMSSHHLKPNQFFVNYNNGIVYVHTDLIAKPLTFAYRGRGVELLSTNRIFHKYNQDSECIVETLSEIVDNFIEEVDEVIERGEEAVRQLIETNETVKQQEEERQVNEAERERVFEEQMSRIEQEIFDKDSEFQTQLGRQQETFEETLEDWNLSFTDLENTLNANEQDRQNLFDQKLQEVEQKILDNESEYNTQLAKFEEDFNERLQDYDSRASEQRDEFRQEFDEKLVEWEGIIPSIGIIDDTSISPTKTWSSEKINDEISIVGTSSNIPNTVVRRDDFGSASFEQVSLGENGFISHGVVEEFGINGLYTGGVKGLTQIVTNDDVDTYSPTAEKIVKRGRGGEIHTTKTQIHGENGVICGGYSANTSKKPIFYAGESSTPQILLTNNDIKNVETGKWTPRPYVEHTGDELIGGESVGHYAIMGNMVLLTCRVRWEALPNAENTGRLIVETPFINVGNATVVNVGLRNGTTLPEDCYDIVSEIPSQTNQLRFYAVRSGANVKNYAVNNLLSSGEIHLAVTYLIGDTIGVG